MNKENPDIRWQQRFINFNKKFNQLARFILKENLNEMETQGLIKAFEYTYELSWKTLQDLLKDKGYVDIAGPRPVIEQCIQDGTIADGRACTYDEETAAEIVKEIKTVYFQLFKNLKIKLDEIMSENKL